MKRNKMKQISKNVKEVKNQVDPEPQTINKRMIRMGCNNRGCSSTVDLCHNHYRYLDECVDTFQPSDGLPTGWSGMYLDLGHEKQFLALCPECSDHLVNFLGITFDEEGLED